MNQYDVIIVGAGASGLYAAMLLSKAGKKVCVLEARNRIGGRIYGVTPRIFGMSSERGAEFVHGAALITQSLIQEAGLTFVPEQGTAWSTRDGTLRQLGTYHDIFPELLKRAKELTSDMTLAEYIRRYIPEIIDTPDYIVVREYVEGYLAGDIEKISARECMNDLSGESVGSDGWIVEGYEALLAYLLKSCEQNGVEFIFDSEVTKINHDTRPLQVASKDVEYRADAVLVTVPVSLYNSIEFYPKIPHTEQAKRIGFGSAIKVLMRFKERMWEKSFDDKLKDATFMLADDEFITWWMQRNEPVLVAWSAGSKVYELSGKPIKELHERAIASCARVFQISEEYVRDQIETVNITDWSQEPFTAGAYSYHTVGSDDFRQVLRTPVDNALYFAGEALCPGREIATVEGAFSSAAQTVESILERK